jgi:hypothetical protein
MESLPQRIGDLFPRTNRHRLAMTNATHLHKDPDTPGTGSGERDTLSTDPMGGAPQTPEPGPDLKSPPPQIKMTPPRIHRPPVVTRTSRPSALRAVQPLAA